MRDPGDLEAVALIERDVPRVGRFEMHRQVVFTDELEAVPHQLAADALALSRTFDTEPRQIPVREPWMASVHLVQDREWIHVVIRWLALRDFCDHGVAAGFDVWREP